MSHCAGTPTHAGLMEQIAAEFAAKECRVAWFEFDYMAYRWQKNSRRLLHCPLISVLHYNTCRGCPQPST